MALLEEVQIYPSDFRAEILHGTPEEVHTYVIYIRAQKWCSLMLASNFQFLYLI
jgi:hypothetical protein